MNIVQYQIYCTYKLFYVEMIISTRVVVVYERTRSQNVRQSESDRNIARFMLLA